MAFPLGRLFSTFQDFNSATAIRNPKFNSHPSAGLFGGGWADDGFDFVDVVGGKAAYRGVVRDLAFIVGFVNAEHFIRSYETGDPLDRWPHAGKHLARLLRRLPQLLDRPIPEPGDVPFDNIFRHFKLLININTAGYYIRINGWEHRTVPLKSLWLKEEPERFGIWNLVLVAS